jgi:putative endonuclease
VLFSVTAGRRGGGSIARSVQGRQTLLASPNLSDVIAGLDPAIQFASASSMATYFVYILASRRNGTLYIGVTGGLSRRAYEHKEGILEGFTKRYGVKLLVYYESYDDIRNAIQREKNLKKWPRAWKIALIERNNPDWRDLYDDLNR